MQSINDEEEEYYYYRNILWSINKIKWKKKMKIESISKESKKIVSISNVNES